MAASETLAMTQAARDLKEQGKDVISLSIGEPDFNTPESIKEAAKKAIDDNFSHYPPVPGYADLKEAVCKKFKRDNNLDFTPDQIIVSTGAKQSIYQGFGIQPAEFGKYATCMLLARYLSDSKTHIAVTKQLWPAIAIICVPILLIILQNDVGSAIPFVFLVLVLYREGLTGWVLTIGFTLIVLLILSILIPQWIIILLITAVFGWIYWKQHKHRKYRAGIITAYCIAVLYAVCVHGLRDRKLKAAVVKMPFYKGE